GRPGRGDERGGEQPGSGPDEHRTEQVARRARSDTVAEGRGSARAEGGRGQRDAPRLQRCEAAHLEPRRASGPRERPILAPPCDESLRADAEREREGCERAGERE